MFLSDLVRKPVCVGKQPRGICLGVGISLKSHAVKYLLCTASPMGKTAEFAVGVSAVCEVEDCISLTRLRSVFPKNCARIFPDRPIYSYEGGYLGRITDMEIRDFTATRLFTDADEVFPVNAIVACSDAVILRKELPFPLGQRVPAPILSMISDKTESVVTKSILRCAMSKSALIKLTLSLPPFNVDFLPMSR